MRIPNLKIIGNLLQLQLIAIILVITIKNSLILGGEDRDIFWITIIIGIMAGVSAVLKSIKE